MIDLNKISEKQPLVMELVERHLIEIKRIIASAVMAGIELQKGWDNKHVIAFRPPDIRWQQMKAIYDACERGGIAIPYEVENFFGGQPPDDNGVEVDIDNLLEEWEDDYRRGYQLELSKLPAEITILRFYNAW